MIKRTLIAIAVVALLATCVHAAQGTIKPWYLSGGDQSAVKVDGSDNPTFRWPYEISYEELVVCNIPIKMDVGMYVKVIDCGKKKIILTQVSCIDIGKEAKQYPCYRGCVEFDVVANFTVKLGAELHKNEEIGIIKNWEAYYDSDTVVPGDGTPTTVKLCVKAWEAQLQNHAAGDAVDVGSVDVTVKPNL